MALADAHHARRAQVVPKAPVSIRTACGPACVVALHAAMPAVPAPITALRSSEVKVIWQAAFLGALVPRPVGALAESHGSTNGVDRRRSRLLLA